MAVTVDAATRELAPRLGPLAALANLPGALAYSARELGLSLLSTFTVQDADLAGLPDAQAAQLVDVAQAYALETIGVNVDSTWLNRLGVKGDADKLRLDYQRRAQAKWDDVRRRYGVGLPTLQAGVIDLDFAAQGDDVTSSSIDPFWTNP